MSANDDNDNHKPLENVLTAAIEDTSGEAVTIRDILELYQERSFGPVFTLLGLLAVLPPLSGIPGMPTTMGIILIIFSGQMLFGRKHIWVPDFIGKRSIKKKKLKETLTQNKDAIHRIDEKIVRRLPWATSKWATRIAALTVIALALMMIPLEFIPFAVALPGITITLLGIGLFSKDGIVMLVGFTLALAAFTFLFVVWPF